MRFKPFARFARSRTIFDRSRLTVIGVCASSGRSAETSCASPRCTPPMPPVAKDLDASAMSDKRGQSPPSSRSVEVFLLTANGEIAARDLADVLAGRKPPDLFVVQSNAKLTAEDRDRRRSRAVLANDIL